MFYTYSQRPKTEQIWIRLYLCSNNQTEQKDRSDFGQTAKLDRFIYKGGHKNYIFIYKTV